MARMSVELCINNVYNLGILQFISSGYLATDLTKYSTLVLNRVNNQSLFHCSIHTILAGISTAKNATYEVLNGTYTRNPQDLLLSIRKKKRKEL